MKGSFDPKVVATHKLRTAGLYGVQGDCNHEYCLCTQPVYHKHDQSTEDREDTQLQI